MRIENISPSTFQLSSIFVLIALWIYFFVYSYRHDDIAPWGFGIVIVGILISGIGYHFYDNHIVVFSITLSLVVGLIGMLWNVNSIRNHFYIRNIGELLRFIGVGLTFGLLFGFIGIITLVTKHFQVPSQYTVTALIAISVQGSMAEELLFRGFLLDYLRKCQFNYVFAIASQALIFAMLHVPLYMDDWLAMLIVFLVGVTAGYLTWKNNNLISAVILHIVFNLVAVIWWLA